RRAAAGACFSGELRTPAFRTDSSPLFGGFHENVDLLQVVQGLFVRPQGVDARFDRFVLTRRRDLEMLGEARREGSCHPTRRIVLKGLVWLSGHGRFEWRLDDEGDPSTP